MEKVDFVLVGSEAVVESGGLINAIGSLQIAIIAKAANKPFYALAERWVFRVDLDRLLTILACSYKFHRLFPLSQYDLPSHNPRILSFPSPIEQGNAAENPASSASLNFRSASEASSSSITPEDIARNNPDVDYTRYAEVVCNLTPFDGGCRPDLISLVFSELGSLTPEGVSQVSPDRSSFPFLRY